MKSGDEGKKEAGWRKRRRRETGMKEAPVLVTPCDTRAHPHSSTDRYGRSPLIPPIIVTRRSAPGGSAGPHGDESGFT